MLLEDYLDAVDFLECKVPVPRDQWVEDLKRRGGAQSFGSIL
jgi:hypothetical protein